MAQSKFFDLVKCFSGTSGPGPLTIGPPVSGFLNFTTGGVSSGDVVSYTIVDGPSPQNGQINASEAGQGTALLNGTTWTLSRDTIWASTSNNTAINCSGKEIVFLTLTAQDLPSLGPVGAVSTTFTADGALGSPIPAGALLIGGKISPNNPFGATISLGTTLGGSDVLPDTVVPGISGGAVPIQGINFSTTIFSDDQFIFAHSPSWGGSSMTVSLWYLLSGPVSSQGNVSASNLRSIAGVFFTNDQMRSEIPRNAVLMSARIVNITNIDVTISLGTTSGGSEILLPVLVPANDVVPLPANTFLQTAWSAADTPVFVNSPAWNGASVAVTLWYLVAS